MYKVDKFDIFKKYDLFEMSMFDVIITKNCIKPSKDTVISMLEYSLINNSELFDIFHVEIYGSFNSNNRENANDVDMRIHIDYPFVKTQLDILEPLLKKQIDISYNKFQILLDIAIYDFDKEFHTTNKNFLESRVSLNESYSVLYPGKSIIKFDSTENRFNNDYFYKKYLLCYCTTTTEKMQMQLINNQYTICTKIQSIDDLNNLYDYANINSRNA